MITAKSINCYQKVNKYRIPYTSRKPSLVINLISGLKQKFKRYSWYYHNGKVILGKKYIIITHRLLQKTEYNWKLQFLNLKVIINIQHYFFIFITENVQNKSNPSLIEKIRSVKYCLCFLFSMM